MPFKTVITASFGLFDCTIALDDIGSEPTYDIEILRQNADPNKAYEIYRASFKMKWNGKQYQSLTHKKASPMPVYWIEMEKLISDLILANQ